MSRRHLAVASFVVLLAGCTTAPSPSPSPTPAPSLSIAPSPEQTKEPSTLRVVDGGPQEGAMGPVTVDDHGRPLTYTVVEGDTADQIRARFDIWWDQLADSEGNRLDTPEIYPGDVFTFTGSLAAFEEEPP